MNRRRVAFGIGAATLLVALVGYVAWREVRVFRLESERAQAVAALNAAQAEAAWWKEATEAALPAFSHLMAVKRSPGPTVDDLDLAGEDAAYLRATLQSIFPDGHRDAPAEQQCVELMRFVCSKTTRKHNPGSGTKVLQDGYGICDGMSAAFIALCRAAALPARQVKMHDLPAMDWHAAAEVYYDGGWHFFDPTFGIFFYSKRTYSGDGNIVGLGELLRAPGSGTMFRVVRNPWLGRYDAAIRELAIVAVDDTYLQGIADSSVSFEEMYRTDLESGFPVAARGDEQLSYPMFADLRDRAGIMLGRGDGSADDLYDHGHRQFGRFGFHTWTIDGAAGCRLAIDYHFQQADPPELIVVPLKGARAVDSKPVDRRVHATVQVTEEQAVVVVFATREAPLDAIEIRKEPALPGQ